MKPITSESAPSLLVSYDISNTKLRTKFSKYLSKFGYRLQYSVFSIKNSDRVLKNIIAEVEGNFADKFTQNDSVMIFHFSKNCKKYFFGYAENENDDLIIV